MTLNVRKHLLIVEDHDEVRHTVQTHLLEAGYKVTAFFDAPHVIRYVHDHGLPHLAVIDIDLPSMDGLELSRKLKTLGDVPIVFLTGKDTSEDIVRGLTEYAADDYITKPFSVDELLARIQRVLSRIPDFYYALSVAPITRIDDRLAVDFGNSRLFVHNEEIVLTPTEAGLLHVLLRNAGEVVSSETLIARVWPNDEIYEEALRVHIHRLRGKLEPDPRRPTYIRTERGVGYRLVIPNDGRQE